MKTLLVDNLQNLSAQMSALSKALLEMKDQCQEFNKRVAEIARTYLRKSRTPLLEFTERVWADDDPTDQVKESMVD